MNPKVICLILQVAEIVVAWIPASPPQPQPSQNNRHPKKRK
jgi:hypothetical protein